MDRTTSYGYDADGNLITVTDPTDATVTYSYTSENEVATITDPTGGTVTYGLRPRRRGDIGHRRERVRDDLLPTTAWAWWSGESEELKVTVGTMSYYTMEPVATYGVRPRRRPAHRDRRRRPYDDLLI